MEYFEKYVSNTIGASVNNQIFSTEGKVRTGRIFYKITTGGTYNYSLLFSNILDSTFYMGDVGHKNLICDSWTIYSARVGVCKHIGQDKVIMAMSMADADENIPADIIVSDLRDLTFGGKKEKQVMPGEFFTTDPIELSYEKDDFMCVEMTYSGPVIPCHPNTILPVYNKTEEGWVYDTMMPVPGMVGCDKKVKKRIGYFGDSITQGSGTVFNKYEHWTALLTEKLGDDFAGWNLGVGFGRANDAATDSAWMFKAKQSDIVLLCMGINDIGRGFSPEETKKDLTTIMNCLKKEGIKVVLQSMPPYTGLAPESIEKWKDINAYIEKELAPQADFYFDIAPHLYVSADQPSESLYGCHPNGEGCAIWAEVLYEQIHDFLQKEIQA